MKLVNHALFASLILTTLVPQASSMQRKRKSWVPFLTLASKQNTKNTNCKGPRYHKKPNRRHKTIIQELQFAHANNLKIAQKLYHQAVMRLLSRPQNGIFTALYQKFNSTISSNEKITLQLSCLNFATATTHVLDAYVENQIKFILGPNVVGDVFANQLATEFDDWYI